MALCFKGMIYNRCASTQGHNKEPFLLRFTSYGGQVGRGWGGDDCDEISSGTEMSHG